MAFSFITSNVHSFLKNQFYWKIHVVARNCSPCSQYMFLFCLLKKIIITSMLLLLDNVLLFSFFLKNSSWCSILFEITVFFFLLDYINRQYKVNIQLEYSQKRKLNGHDFSSLVAMHKSCPLFKILCFFLLLILRMTHAEFLLLCLILTKFEQAPTK